MLINVSDTPSDYEDTTGPAQWSESRYKQMMYLRQKALDSARKQWADYLIVGFFAFSRYQQQSNPVNTDMESKQVSVLTGVGIKQVEFRENVRAFCPQGQNKLSIIMMCRYEAGVCKAGFDCT